MYYGCYSTRFVELPELESLSRGNFYIYDGLSVVVHVLYPYEQLYLPSRLYIICNWGF